MPKQNHALGQRRIGAQDLAEPPHLQGQPPLTKGFEERGAGVCVHGPDRAPIGARFVHPFGRRGDRVATDAVQQAIHGAFVIQRPERGNLVRRRQTETGSRRQMARVLEGDRPDRAGREQNQTEGDRGRIDGKLRALFAGRRL